MTDKELIERARLSEKEKAKLKGFDNVVDWYLACLNAEVNVLADPDLRDTKRIDKFVEMARRYIDKLAEAIPIIKEDERRKVFQELEDSTYIDWEKDLFVEIDTRIWQALKEGKSPEGVK